MLQTNYTILLSRDLRTEPSNWSSLFIRKFLSVHDKATSMLETNRVGDNFKMLVTILYLLTSALGTNIQKMSRRSKFCRQHSKMVTNCKSSTSQCHQHDCSPRKRLQNFRYADIRMNTFIGIIKK